MNSKSTSTLLRRIEFSRIQLSFIAFLGLVASACSIAIAFVSATLFGELLSDAANVPVLVALLSLLLVLKPLLEAVAQVAQNRLGSILKIKLRTIMLDKFNNLGPMRSQDHSFGEVHSALSDGVEALEPYLIKYRIQVFVTSMSALAIAAFLATLSPLIAVILVICGLGTVYIPRLWERALSERGQEHWQAYEQMNSQFIDAMMGMTTLKAFGAADRFGQRLSAQSEQLLRKTLAQLRLSLGESGLSGLMKVLGPALVLFIAIGEIRSGDLDLSSLFVIIMLSIEFFRPFIALSAAWHESFFGISALPTILRLIDSDGFEESTPLGTEALTDYTITGNAVSYQYESPVLHGIDFRIPGGKTTAIVGASGSGKSTLVGLLMGFDAPNAGTLTIGNVPLSKASAHANVALVPQNPVIFEGTIRSSLQDVAPQATDQDMLVALSTVQLNRAELGTADVLNTHIEEYGNNLSGGQCQRLAIARALMRGSGIVVLDESTSALDSRTEVALLEAIRRNYPELTIIIVTHRLETALHTDHIVALQPHGPALDGDAKLIRATKVWRELEGDPMEADYA